MIRLASPGLAEAELEDALGALGQVLSSGWLVQGRHVEAFEKAVAEVVGVSHAIAVNSGTSALHLTLLALEIGPGDAVAVPAYSHVATANVVELCGAELLFIDVEPDTFNMDPERLADALDGRPASAAPVKAIVPVHAFGQMADMEAIGAIAGRHGAAIVEDAACALGATFGGRRAGAAGRAGCFSFHPRKIITTGEGGMVTTGDAELAGAVRRLRNHGQEPGSAPPEFVAPGLNQRLTELQAVLGSAALRRLDDGIAARRAAAARYDALLADCVTVPAVAAGSEPVYQAYVTLLPPAAAAGRGALIARLLRDGIETQIGTYSIPLTAYYRRRYAYDTASFPVSSDLYTRALALPMHEKLGAGDLERVSERLHLALATGEGER